MTNENDLEVATVEDFFVQRDGDDNLQPVEQPLPGLEEHIRVVPMTLGDVNQYGLDDGQVNLTDEEVADILNNHWYDVVQRDDFEVTAEMVGEDMVGFGKTPLVQAILRASGYDMQNAINMEQMEMLAEMDEDKLKNVMSLAESQGT